jgi:excisionase family DNA binding protein
MLETPKQLARRVGLSEGQVRHLINTNQLEFVPIGERKRIPSGAFERFIEERSVKPCRDKIKDRGFVGSTSANASTSHGPKAVAAVSAQLARQTAKKLKSNSRNGSALEGSAEAQVIRLRSS